MECASFWTVLHMPWFILLVARQYFRFKPRSCLVPKGILWILHRLWKVRLKGWRNEGEHLAWSISLKFCCRDRFGAKIAFAVLLYMIKFLLQVGIGLGCCFLAFLLIRLCVIHLEDFFSVVLSSFVFRFSGWTLYILVGCVLVQFVVDNFGVTQVERGWLENSGWVNWPAIGNG